MSVTELNLFDVLWTNRLPIFTFIALSLKFMLINTVKQLEFFLNCLNMNKTKIENFIVDLFKVT